MADHPIREFIRRKLDESVNNGEITVFTRNSSWESVANCRVLVSENWVTLDYLRVCRGCGDREYPCRRLKLTASYWDDDPEFKEEWRLV